MKIINKEFHHLILQGSSYEVGRQQAELIKNDTGWVRFVKSGKSKFNNNEFEKAQIFLEKVCPGLNDELRGMADYFGVPVKYMSFYYHSYLRPHCSTFCVLPEKSADGHIYVCRNYDFNYKIEDYRLCTTKIDGKFEHTGFSTMLFGRNEGINDQGLCVTMSSTGIGVGATKWLRSPALQGAQFWLIVRGILENCKNVDEAVKYAQKNEIAFNINLLLTDKDGNSCLFETFDGHKAIKKIGKEQFLGSTNHAIIPEIKKYSGKIMRHSLIRYQAIEKLFKTKDKLSLNDLKSFCSNKYPYGLTVLFYRKFLGTTYSLIFDLTGKKTHVCFGSPNINQWKIIDMKNIQEARYPCEYIEEIPPKDFMELL
jgi:predicted choloylglycine hydrolase